MSVYTEVVASVYYFLLIILFTIDNSCSYYLLICSNLFLTKLVAWKKLSIHKYKRE